MEWISEEATTIIIPGDNISLMQLSEPEEIMSWFQRISQVKNYHIGPSPLDGEGVFAARDFSPGDVIGLVFDDTQSQLQQNAMDNRTELGQFINHSFATRANSELAPDDKTLICLRPIAYGEEITTDYLHPRAVKRTGIPDIEKIQHFK